MRLLRDLRCPACGKPPLDGVLPSLAAAMEAQAKRLGVDIECRRCGHQFRYRTVSAESNEAIEE